MKDEPKAFYQFNGCWFDVFDMLVGIIKPTNTKRFSVWESRQKLNAHLLIVYGPHLDEEWERRYNIKTITEPEFEKNYRAKMSEHIIHGYNEFNKTKTVFSMIL